MIIEQIQRDAVEARKQRDKIRANLLTTVMSDARSIGKEARQGEPTDGEVIGVVRKFLKNIDESLARSPDGSHRGQLETEQTILRSYLPRQMDQAEMERAIDDIIAEQPERTPKAMGAVMKTLKERHEGTYDARAASSMVKEKLA